MGSGFCACWVQIRPKRIGEEKLSYRYSRHHRHLAAPGGVWVPEGTAEKIDRRWKMEKPKERRRNKMVKRDFGNR
jgi:hypothetical protein